LKQQQAQIQKIEVKTAMVLFKCLGDWTDEELRDVSTSLESYSRSLRETSIQWDVSEVG
jgi:hypothetical protein